ncbi:MAG: alpha/beta hydrolase, partial [Oscillospiraceae bacterium]
MYFKPEKIQTSRLETTYYRAGKPGLPKLMLIHGNASSAVFYHPLMKRLQERFDMIAPDMRGFGDSEALAVDATRGMRDFSDDADALAEALGWDSFSLLGWSLGGGVAMQYAIDHGEKLEKLILEAPLSPFGFGGTYDEDGKKLQPLGLASGGGCANPQLVAAIEKGDRAFIAQVLDTVYVAPPFQIDPELKELYIDGVLSTKLGEGLYPGDSAAAAVWPFFAAGDRGICNTMAPNFCDLSALADIAQKPPILWIRGAQDIMVSDTSLCDLAYLGKVGAVPGWPGEPACPPQPMLAQTRYVLEKYKAAGGTYSESVIPGGHGCMLDNEPPFSAALI